MLPMHLSSVTIKEEGPTGMFSSEMRRRAFEKWDIRAEPVIDGVKWDKLLPFLEDGNTTFNWVSRAAR